MSDVPRSALLGYEFVVRMGRRRVEVYAYDYSPPFYGGLYEPPEPEAVEVAEDDVWLAPRMAPPRKRPKRLAKKIAKRGGELHFDDGRALTEGEIDRLHDDEHLQEALCEAAGQLYREDAEAWT